MLCFIIQVNYQKQRSLKTLSVRVRNRRARPTGVNWATLSPELCELAPLRDLRRSQQLRDKRREMKSAQAGSNPTTTASQG